MGKQIVAKNVKPSGQLNPRVCCGCKKHLESHFVRHAGTCNRWTGWIYLNKAGEVLSEDSKYIISSLATTTAFFWPASALLAPAFSLFAGSCVPSANHRVFCAEIKYNARRCEGKEAGSMPKMPKKRRNSEMEAYSRARSFFNRWCKEKFAQLNQATAEEGFWYMCTRLFWMKRLPPQRALELLSKANRDAYNYRDLAKTFPAI